MVKDLRNWIAQLDSHGLLKRVKEPVDVRQCPELIFENYKQATLFEVVDGYDSKVIANAFSSRKMMSVALETDEKEVLNEYLSRISKPIKPIFEPSIGRCQEVIHLSNEVDLSSLPILLQHEYDGAPYFTAGVLVAKDPETSEYNIGIYRLMFRKSDELGINITAPHKLRWFYQKAYEKGKPLNVAVCIGLHALDYLASVTTSPEGTDELAVWGGLQEEAIKMVRCRTLDLYVPEHSEIVLEATMDPIGWSESEGMYGEFPGTYSGMKKNPVLKVRAVTSRRNPVYQSATHGGRHLAYTDFFVIIPQIELSIFQALKNSGVDVRQVRILPESAGMVCFASINVRANGDSRNAIYQILSGSRQNFPKYCVVVDSDIAVIDDDPITWELPTRTQPKEDTVILEGMRIPSSADPSLGGTTRIMSKLGIDATIPYAADKTKFLHSKPPIFEPSSRNIQKATPEMIERLLRENGPLFFYDVVRGFSGETFRSILRAWSELREQGKIELGADGKYLLKKSSA